MAEETAPVGRYLLDRLAGRGGMGEVYRARDAETGELVAVKLLGPQSHERKGRLQERFAREARTLQTLSGPAIVKYIDHGITRDDRPYLVMEWLEGQTLDTVLSERGLNGREVLTLALRMVQALRALNTLSVVHRDIKPANIMLVGGQAEQATLVDFGIARAGFESLTRTGHLVGTPFYMAPEQVKNARTVDARADVFSLGAVLYECLTGRLPFPALDALAFIARLSAGETTPIVALRSSVPSALSELIGRLLIRDREHRPFADAQLEAGVSALLEDPESWQALGPVTSQRRTQGTTSDSAPISSDLAGGTALATHDSQPGRTGQPDVRSAKNSFVGRAFELSLLAKELASPGAGVVVWGLPGIGKSRLSSEASAQFVAAQPSVRVALELDMSDVQSGDDVIRLLCARLGTRPQATLGQRELLIHLGRMLRARGEPVLVIDGAEAKPEALSELLEVFRAPELGARIIVTSRERLQLPGLSDLELGPLSVASHDDAELSFAAQLLVERAGLSSRTHTAAERAAANRIAGALDGNPLALELAAARVAMVGLTVEAMSTDSPVQLLGGANSKSARPLLEALAQAVSRLSDAEQRALYECTVFHGGFTVQAAEAILTAEPEVVLLDVLSRLRERSLIRPQSEGTQGVRFFMPGAVRDFAREQLSETQARTLRERRIRYFLATAGALASELERTGATVALVKLTTEAENVLAVVHDALASTDETALAALLAYDPIASLRGPIAPQVALLERALASVDASSLLAARGRQARGRHLGLLDRYDDAHRELEAVLALAEQHGADDLCASVQLDLAVLDHVAQHFDSARGWYQAVLSGADPSPRVEARALANLAALAYDERDCDTAIQNYEEALAVLEAIADERQLALTSMNLAVLLQETGERENAREHYQRAVACFERLGDVRLWGITLSNLGMLELEVGALEAAVSSQQRAQRFLAQSGDERSEALCWGRLGASLSASGDVRGAIVAFRRAERMTARRDQAARQTVRVYGAFLDLARARQAQENGRTTAAGQALDAACARMREADHPSADGTPPVSTHSDDVRTALRVLNEQLVAFKSESPT